MELNRFRCFPLNGTSYQNCLPVLPELNFSEHPLAQAIVKASRAEDLNHTKQKV
jgi:cation transport ATPase